MLDIARLLSLSILCINILSRRPKGSFNNVEVFTKNKVFIIIGYNSR